MSIRIDDDVPLPEPSKPDTWVSISTPTTKRHDGGWVKSAYDEAHKAKESPRKAGKSWTAPERYPAETTYDAKRVPIVDCFLVGGPLNGKHGPIVGTARIVELNIYLDNGEVGSVELYELGDNGQLGVRHWKGTKQ